MFRIHVKGTWGHGSMPREDNALVLAAEAVRRLASPGEPRLTAPMREFLGRDRAAALPPEQAGASWGHRRRRSAPQRGGDPHAVRPGLGARPARAAARHDQPAVLNAGVKYNVIPGEATLMIDCRTLPGTTPDDMREEVLARLGDLAPHCTLEHVIGRVARRERPRGPVRAPGRDAARPRPGRRSRSRSMTPFATDAKTTTLRLGVPTYGFTPLRLEPGEPFLARYPRRRRAGRPRRAPVRAAGPLRRGRDLLRLNRAPRRASVVSAGFPRCRG